MPWACLPFEDRARKTALSAHFEVEGIPTLVILDEDMNVITTEAVGEVGGDEECKKFPWKAPLVSDIDTSCNGIDSKPALVVIHDLVASDEQAANEKVLTELAAAQAERSAALEAASAGKVKTCFDAEGEEQFAFFTAKETGGRLRDRVADECKVPKDVKKTQVVLLTIHKNGGYYAFPAETPFNRDSAEKFLKDFQDGKLTRLQMGADEEE